MWINYEISYGFEPVKEYEDIEKFKKANDMSKFEIHESTTAIVFVFHETYFMEKRKGESEE